MPWQHDNPVTRRLGIGLPIIQGPFGGGLSSVDLVAAVSQAGGLGSFGVHHLRGEGILDTARAIRQATGAPFALNLWIPLQQRLVDGVEWPEIDDAAWQRAIEVLQPCLDALGLAAPARPRPEDVWPRYEDQVEAVLEARPAVFSFCTRSRTVTIMSRYFVSAATSASGPWPGTIFVPASVSFRHASAAAIIPPMLPPVEASMNGYIPLKNRSPMCRMLPFANRM